jgi:hypothetical protein
MLIPSVNTAAVEPMVVVEPTIVYEDIYKQNASDWYGGSGGSGGSGDGMATDSDDEYDGYSREDYYGPPTTDDDDDTYNQNDDDDDERCEHVNFTYIVDDEDDCVYYPLGYRLPSYLRRTS